jgi:TonB-dependent SusC/RagA subfamily outer membrane receptor
MDNNRLHLKTIIFFLFTQLSFVSYSQNLIESRHTSYFTYIFKITDSEARQIYKKDLWKVDEKFFHTIVDSVPTDSVFKRNLPVGHYLRVHTIKNKLSFDVTSVQNFDVIILDNNTDLVVQVFDLKGDIIPDAEVSVRMKRIHFDNKSKAYIDKKSNQKGLLRVTRNGFTAYYDLSRKYNNSYFRRTSGKIVYGTPLHYVWLPIRYVISLPFDGISSLSSHYPQGSIRRTAQFFRKTFYKIACVFDDYYCDYYGSVRNENKYKGYLVFNKPQYLPNDTVKFKAYLVNGAGKPIKSDLSVVLQGPKKNVTLGKVSPYAAGGYTFNFFLHDSLNLQLDRSYLISLEGKRDKAFITQSFKYEDYELRSLNLVLTVDTAEQYYGKKAILKVKGTDENDLNVLDGRLEVLIRPGELEKYFGAHVFIPDTLAYWHRALDREAETRLEIPDSIFPHANLAYDVSVTLLTTNNEKVTKNEKLRYNFYKSEIKENLVNDSIELYNHKNGVPQRIDAKVYGEDKFGNRTFLRQGLLPLKTDINPYYSQYIVETDSIKAAIDISSENSLFECFSERSKDSIRIAISNPRKLFFNYFIYKRSIQKKRGYSDSLKLDIPSPGNETWFISVQYLWAGKVINENYQIPYFDKKLKIAVTEPKIVYPSQNATIELLVTDPEGRPVPDVDLTAYSITKKFSYIPSTIPYMGKQGRNKIVINNFTIKDHEFEQSGEKPMDYKKWRHLAGLDSIEYYKFIYPGNTIYKYQYPSEITQFAPFLISNGGILPIHVIYIDSKPVYFSWSTNTQPYSFIIDSGYHHIKLRTSTSSFELDSIYFPHHKKSIISLRDSIYTRNVLVRKEEPLLSDSEKNVLYKYIFPYRYQFGGKLAYIEQANQIQLLKPEASGRINNLAGPVYPYALKFQLLDGFSTTFEHEPFFEYEFTPGLLKMRSVDSKKFYPESLFTNYTHETLSDEVMSVPEIKETWQEYLNERRYSTARYTYSKNTSKGMGKLQLEIITDSSKIIHPLNILLFRYDEKNFLRVYPGNNLFYHDLQGGYYKIIFFFPGSEYAVADSVFVKADGLNLERLRMPERHKKDAFSISVSKIIEENIFKSGSYNATEENQIKQFYRQYQTETKFNGQGDIIEGYIYDDSGEPLPGVTIMIKGTEYGTISGPDGYYSLNVPRDRNKLVVSYIGYKQEQVEISGRKNLNINLTPEVLRLDEVVVVGYGTQKKSSLAGSVAVTTTNAVPAIESDLLSSLQGRVSGISISHSTVPDSTVVITIRGANTTNFKAEPLYVIDGVIFTGNISELDPGLIKGIQILKDSNATAIYGARGANGVVVINTGGSFKTAKTLSRMGADYDENFYQSASQASSIRDNFSDYAFWQPKLMTDKDGKASFKIQFPDDVTSWRTFYLAMNGNKQSGQAEGLIRSYKPLMAQLSVPRFLIENDTAKIIGKVLNYTSDTIPVKVKLEVNDTAISEQIQNCSKAIIDTLQLTANRKDSISVKYYLEKEDGYFDGEKRYIPIFPAGLEKTEGQFYVLDKDTTFNIHFNQNLGEVRIYAKADILEIIGDEISRLIDYKYSCNEQLASKLIALLGEQTIAKFMNKSYKKGNQIDKIIRLLNRNKREDELWGWWKSSTESSLWISLHVLEALTKAREMGYNVSLNETKITDGLMWEVMRSTSIEDKLNAIRILRRMNAKVDFPALITSLEKRYKLNIGQLFRLIEIKQACGIKVNIDTLDAYRKETMFGNIFFTGDSIRRDLLSSNIQNTLLAYRIIRSDSTGKDHKVTLRKMMNYFFENRQTGCWMNTYESSLIIETILPDLLVSRAKFEKSKLTLSGAINKAIDKFPFEASLLSNDTLRISKSGDSPIYFTSYQQFWDSSPEERKSDFEITTSFGEQADYMLKAGKEVNLKVQIKVLKDAEYVMINIPIPGACSYSDKSIKSPWEVYRESFRNETAIFCEKLKSGNYEFTVSLIPRYTGKYALNPAKVELMYFPTFNANNTIKKVLIE